MSIKTGSGVFLAILVVGMLIMVGCENPAGGGGTSPIAEVGDTLTGGWEVTFVDVKSNGQGFFAERTSEYDGTEETQVLVQGTFHDNIKFTKDKAWYLSGAVFIGNNSQDPSAAVGNKLEIEPGTVIRGDTSSSNPGVLIITRGSDIDAQGTAAEPITFTSANEPGDRDAGDWGGLILNGYARVQGGYAEGEGGTGEYGGGASPIAADNSGTIKYVRVQFGGKLFTSDNELNGIVFQGVGSGTTVEYIQVHLNADDGIEFFGGSVQVKYYVGTGNEDDTLDGDDAWNGSAQHVILHHYPGDAGSLIEADGDAEDVFPPSNAILANITAISSTATDSGFRFKSDANYDMYNSVIHMKEADDKPVVTDDDSTTEFDGVLFVGGTLATAKETAINGGTGNEILGGTGTSGVEGAVVTAPVSGVWPTNFAFAANEAGAVTAQTVPDVDPAGNELDATTYIGAFDGTDEWWDGWIDTPEN
jgi:trimeric autotransporter adhesin